MDLERIGDLELNQDLRFQEREWRAERVGWAALIIVVALAASGLFGHGPISWSTASTASGSFRVEYERFGRLGGTQEFVVAAPASEAKGGRWEIEFAADYAAAVTVDAVVPEPESVEVAIGTVRYTFVQAEPGADLEARFAVTPSSLWRVRGEVGSAAGDQVTVSQFFFP